MGHVSVQHLNDITLLRMCNGVTNAIGPELVQELHDWFEKTERDSRALLLCGGDKFFSMGFDLPTILLYNHDEMAEFFENFNSMVLRLFTLSVPTACALKGHAIAGGGILAICCDYRFGAAERKLGLNEVLLGVPVPYLADQIMRLLVPDSVASDLLYLGTFLKCSDLQDHGLVTALDENLEVESIAIQKLESLLRLPKSAFAAVKRNRTEAIKDLYNRNYKERNAGFIYNWFTNETQELLKEAARKF